MNWAKYNVFSLMIILTITLLTGCKSNGQESINCNDSGCYGVYKGAEYKGFSDVAHQFSNLMSAAVGDKLKELYENGKYSKVDLPKIKMTTEGMNHIGDVQYSLEIPFIQVSDSCEAYTAFDHRGGWGHERDSLEVIHEFRNVSNLDIIKMSTPEGLQEYWVQWKHKSYQSNCK